MGPGKHGHDDNKKKRTLRTPELLEEL